MDKMDYPTALAKAMRFCSTKEVCKSDMVQKCHQWSVDEHVISKVIETLEKEKFIDEERYATAFVNDKFRFNKWGKLKIKAHLRAKKVDAQIVEKALGNIDDSDYYELIKQLAQSKNIKAKNDFERKQKMLRFLSQRGFETDCIYTVLEDLQI